MAVIKVACPKCNQKVSGDASFYGRAVNCPICTSKIIFPDNPKGPAQNPPASGAMNDAFPAAELPPAEQPPQAPPQDPSFDTIAPGGASAPSQSAVTPSFDELPPQAAAAAVGSPAAGNSAYHDQEGDEQPASPIFGIIAMVAGILNVITLCIPGIILAPIAIILGHIGLTKAKNSPVQPAPGKTFALVGTILGYVGILGTIIMLATLLLSKGQFMEALDNAKAEAEAAAQQAQ